MKYLGTQEHRSSSEEDFKQSINESTAIFWHVSNNLPQAIPGILGSLIKPPPGRDLTWRGVDLLWIKLGQNLTWRGFDMLDLVWICTGDD